MKKNVNNKDFSNELLPKTRKEQFFQIIKDNYRVLLKIGFFSLLLLIPFLFAFVFKQSYLLRILNDSSLDKEKARSLFITFEPIFNAIYIPCFMIFFTGFGGILKVLRRLLWNEPLFFKKDFWLGVKDNLKHNLLVGFLVPFLYFFSFFTIRLLGSDVFSYVAFLGFSFLIFVPILIITDFIGSIYMNKVRRSLSIGIRTYLRRGVFVILALLPIYALYLVSIIPLNSAYLALIYAVIFVFLLPILILLNYIVSFKIFDELFNIYYYPEVAYLGLYISEDLKNKIAIGTSKAKEENEKEE